MPMKPLTAEEIAEMHALVARWREAERVEVLAYDPATPTRVWNWSDRMLRLLDEIERARTLLKHIEYGSYTATDNASFCCPCCRAEDPRNFQSSPPAHVPGCELAALIGHP